MILEALIILAGGTVAKNIFSSSGGNKKCKKEGCDKEACRRCGGVGVDPEVEYLRGGFTQRVDCKRCRGSGHE